MELSVLPFLLVAMMGMVSSVPVIHAPWGALKGIVVEGDGGRKMNAYLGIPYAVPPVGERRFKKPEAHPGMEKGKVFEADKIMPACPQRPVLVGRDRELSEDCLMLDVYVPAEDDSSTTKPYAVMVFIHGGGFLLGDASFYRPSRLVADGQVIVVELQYRLGLFGFFYSGDDAIPENLGLWDQNLALRWVKDNVQAFGGDPDRITIFGESAGSMSVGFHLIMPQSKGLFKRAILQSGTPQDVVHFIDIFDKKTVFKKFATLVGCEGESSQQIMQCLMEQPMEYLMNKSAEFEMSSPLSNYYFPVADGVLVPGRPRDLARDADFMRNIVGDVDVIVGFTKQEGALILATQVFAQIPLESLLTADFFRGILDMCFGMMKISNNTALKKTTEFFYRGSESTSNVSSTLDPLVDMYGDCLLTVACAEWAGLLAAAPHTAARYLYVLDHDFVFNRQGPVPGAHHGDDLLLLFDSEREMPEDFLYRLLNKTTIAEEELPLSRKVVDVWTSFAKTGNPSPPLQADLGGEWPQFTAEGEDYLSISHTPRVVSRMGPYRDRVALWLSLLPQLDTLLTSKPDPQQAAEAPPTPREDL